MADANEWDMAQWHLTAFVECGKPVKGMASSGIIQHVRSLNLLFNLETFRALNSKQLEDLNTNLSNFVKLFHAARCRVHMVTVQGLMDMERRLNWDQLGKKTHDALQKLVRSTHVKTLRLVYIKAVPPSFFKGTSFTELFLDTIIKAPKAGDDEDEPEDREDDDEEEEDEEDDEGSDEENDDDQPKKGSGRAGISASDAAAISHLPLAKLRSLGVKLMSKKAYSQALAIMDKASDLEALEFICGERFHFSRPFPWDKYPTIERLTIGNDTPEDELLNALLSCVNSAVEMVGPESDESVPIPNILFKAEYADGSVQHSVCRRYQRPDPKLLDATLSGHLFADVEKIKWIVMANPVGEREPSTEWEDELLGQVLSFYNFPKLYRSGRRPSGEVHFVLED